MLIRFVYLNIALPRPEIELISISIRFRCKIYIARATGFSDRVVLRQFSAVSLFRCLLLHMQSAPAIVSQLIIHLHIISRGVPVGSSYSCVFVYILSLDLFRDFSTKLDQRRQTTER